MFRIILASESPRRRELLENAGVKFEILATNADESADIPMPPSDYALTMSKRKLDSAVEKICGEGCVTDTAIIAADTIVSIDGRILGKPKNGEDAYAMLKLLEGRQHSVYTGLSVAFIRNGNIEYEQECCLTRVEFKPLSDSQIELYISTGEPFGKAGSYAIQGKGGELVKRIEGDYNNVVGLPVDRLLRH